MSETRKPMDADWMSLQAAADRIGASRTKTLALIVKGDLIGKHVAERTVVERKSVERYARQMSKAA
jgi:hypothetical protein